MREKRRLFPFWITGKAEVMPTDLIRAIPGCRQFVQNLDWDFPAPLFGLEPTPPTQPSDQYLQKRDR